MVFSANIVTVAEMQFMAGENRDATGDVDANHIFLQDYAEAYLSGLLKFNLSTGFSALTAGIKVIITEWAARFAGMELIRFNMAGYTSRVEAEDMINIHTYRMRQIEKLLEDASIQDFIGV
ncbi:MAG: hypothetical protein O2871_04170 [bacterium]|nr:hypothetical protein [bacterium]